jgi:SAM-dependent methyltransferase
MASKISKIIKYYKAGLLAKIIPQFLYVWAKKFTYLYAKELSNLQKFSPKGQVFAIHLENLEGLFFKPQQNIEWLETGFLCRRFPLKDKKILDLCCGDGLYSYIFFSDAYLVDAIDFSSDALKFSQKMKMHHPNIKYSKIDILREPFPQKKYDLIFWRAGIAYFSTYDLKKILQKISKSLNKNGYLIGSSPLPTLNAKKSSGQINLKYSRTYINKLLKNNFKSIELIDSFYENKQNLSFICGNN